MSVITLNEPGKELLMMGNEAIARGALEAGVRVGAAYPGTPSTDIIENLAAVASQMGLYVEWSVNEKVALEVASAAAFSGLRAICAMKQNGMNVASDYLLTLNLVGVKTGWSWWPATTPRGIRATTSRIPGSLPRWPTSRSWSLPPSRSPKR